MGECSFIPPREIEPSETTIAKDRVTRYQELLFFRKQADAAGSMSRGMDDFQGSDLVSFREEALCGNARRPGTEMKRETQVILKEARSIEVVNGYF